MLCIGQSQSCVISGFRLRNSVTCVYLVGDVVVIVCKKGFRMKKMAPLLIALGSMITATVAHAATARIAVAANFTKTIEEVGQVFNQKTGHDIRFAFGPTGKLFTQIQQGAPYDAFFGADEKRPLKTLETGTGIKGSYFVYAKGKIVLFSWDYPVDQNALEVLKKANFNHFAIANPKTAPYGEGAVAFLKKHHLYKDIQPKLVQGESISQAYQYVYTRNASIGILALSQIKDPESPLQHKGSYWTIPTSDYKPIKQGAVLLKHGCKNEAAKAFLAFMKTPEALAIMARYGYASGSKSD